MSHELSVAPWWQENTKALAPCILPRNQRAGRSFSSVDYGDSFFERNLLRAC